MPELTRRRSEHHRQCWHIYYGDVHVGTIAERVGNPHDTEADFQAWRDERDWTERKYALWDAGRRLEPPQLGPGKPSSRFMKCPCAEVFDMHGPEAVLMHVPHITVRESLPRQRTQ
jgi:hypothetical protein